MNSEYITVKMVLQRKSHYYDVNSAKRAQLGRVEHRAQHTVSVKMHHISHISFKHFPHELMITLFLSNKYLSSTFLQNKIRIKSQF